VNWPREEFKTLDLGDERLFAQIEESVEVKEVDADDLKEIEQFESAIKKLGKT
jgi:hypothetical protein